MRRRTAPPPATSGSEPLASLLRPSDASIAALLSDDGRPFNYPEVGATRTLEPGEPHGLDARYAIDHHRFTVARGHTGYDRAREALAHWRHFEIPWIEFLGGNRPVEPGAAVATRVRVGGVWFLAPCRVVYTELDRAPRDGARFAYGALEGHAESGEERFTVLHDPATDEVRYRVDVFSRPTHLLPRLARRWSRRMQRRFVEASAAALTRACRR